MLVRGRIYAPVDPYARELATSVTYDAKNRSLILQLHDRRIRIPTEDEGPFLERDRSHGSDVRYLPVARVASALGDTFVYDARAATLTISSRPAGALATPSPYAERTPQAASRTFTPYAVPTPVPTITGIPRPRRTPILVEPDVPGDR